MSIWSVNFTISGAPRCAHGLVKPSLAAASSAAILVGASTVVRSGSPIPRACVPATQNAPTVLTVSDQRFYDAQSVFLEIRFGLTRNSVAGRGGEMQPTRTTRVRDRRKRRTSRQIISAVTSVRGGGSAGRSEMSVSPSADRSARWSQRLKRGDVAHTQNCQWSC